MEKDILLYGLRDERFDFFYGISDGKINLGKKTFRTDKECYGFPLGSYIIDHYNDSFAEKIYTEKRILQDPEQWKNFSQNWLNDISPSYKNLPLWEEYYRCMKITPKTQKKLLEDPIKQGCKNGVDMAIVHPNIMIYFVLDNLDMNLIVTKSKAYSSSYTGHELRYVYRRWSEAKEKIVFFEKNKEVPAPWVAGEYQKVWKSYQPKSWHEIKKNLQVHQINDQPVIKEQEQLVQRSQIRSQLPLYKHVNRAKAASETGRATASDRTSNTKVHNGKERL
ncbi:hypothetical protein E1H99_07555 [Enterococcus hirae]|nr:hypothetical protein E1H99_07555 [Enterococcus hirae]